MAELSDCQQGLGLYRMVVKTEVPLVGLQDQTRVARTWWFFSPPTQTLTRATDDEFHGCQR